MSKDLHEKVLAFLAGEFARKAQRQCIRLELTHAPLGHRGDSLRVWEREESPEIFDDLTQTEKLVGEIIRMAEEEADAWPGPQRFVLRTTQFLAGGAKTTFIISPEFTGGENTEALALAEAAGGVGSAAGGTVQGGALSVLQNALAMEMRHNERNMQINAQMFKGTIDVLGNANTELVTENQKLREERAQMMKELEEARSAQGERDLRGLAQIASDARKDKAVGKLLTLAPVVVSKVLGKEGMPGAPTPLSILVSELGKSLTPQQIANIARSLSVEQQILFAEAMKQAKTSAESAEEKTESKTNGADTATPSS
jgi:hypothetical protein